MFGGGKRLVIVEEADEFVTAYRGLLEEYVARPKSGGVLVLEVKTWASNTRLYKALAETGLQIECKAPADAALAKWLSPWARKQHAAALSATAAERLVEMVGPEMGLLDQELAKLALLAGPGGKITDELVQESVGGWRAKTAWEMLDAAAFGDAREALAQLDRLLSAGENAIAILGQIAFTLRRFAAAARLVEQAEAAGGRISLRQALEQAGFKTWPAAMQKAERQLQQIGRRRARQLYRWLLEADLALKGPSSAPARARLVLEQLIVRMSKNAREASA
jgi:DNA polymerase-3 subunit delta